MESLNTNDNDHTPSADDIAWVDSYLIKLTEAPDADWTLLELLDAPTEQASLFAADNESNDYTELENIHTFLSAESAAATFSSMMIDDPSDEDEESTQGEDNAVERLKGKSLILNALLPVHAEFAKVEENSDLGFDLDSLTFKEGTSSSDDIFKVWDLSVSLEDEFTKAMNSSFSPSLPVASSSGVADGSHNFALEAEPLDALIAGIAELSLGRVSN